MDPYSVSLVRRTPKQDDPPSFEEVGPIPAPSGLSWSDLLNQENEATVSCVADGLPESVKEAIRHQISDMVFDPDSGGFVAVEPPSLELWIWRDGVLVPGSGPIVGYQFQGGGQEGITLTFNVRGPEYLLRFAYASTDLDYRNVDQHAIAADLVDQWQALDWGHMGIDTSGVVPSGQTRTRFYPRGDNVFQRLVELGEVRGGFDWWIDSARALQLAGQKGDDRSGQVTLDRRNVTSPNLHVSLAAGSIASVALALNTDDENPLAAEEENPDLLASAGRLGWVESFDGVTEQGTLDDYAERLLGDRDGPLVGAQPEAIPVAGADAMSFEAGDRIEMAFDPGVGLVVFRRRVLAKRVTVSDDGNETIGVEFV